MIEIKCKFRGSMAFTLMTDQTIFHVGNSFIEEVEKFVNLMKETDEPPVKIETTWQRGILWRK